MVGSSKTFQEYFVVWNSLEFGIVSTLKSEHSVRQPEMNQLGYVISTCKNPMIIWLVLWNIFMTFHILGMSSSQLIFQRGRYTTNQLSFSTDQASRTHRSWPLSSAPRFSQEGLAGIFGVPERYIDSITFKTERVDCWWGLRLFMMIFLCVLYTIIVYIYTYYNYIIATYAGL